MGARPAGRPVRWRGRWSLLLICFSLLLTGEATASPPPNIVLIVADNQSASALAAYGNRDVHTPNLDELAHAGLLFTHAYAANGMCSPTRATLLTGLMPSQHGVHNALSDPWVDRLDSGWNAVAEFRTVPYTLAQRGYQTAMIGKWHLGDPRRPALGFEHWVALPYGHTLDFWSNTLVVNGKSRPIEGRHIVDVLAEEASAYLAKVDPSRPFFLQLNLDGPYALPPTNAGPARNRHYARYAGASFESMPREPIADGVLSRLSGPYIPGQSLFELRDLDATWDHLLYGTIRMQGDPASYANFLSQNTLVDDAVGRIVDALRARGLEDDTVVIYTADQGNLFGQHGLWGHTIWLVPAHLYEEAMRIPLIVVDPRGRHGETSDRLIGQYDFAPTLLALAGATDVSLPSSPGTSFLEEIRGTPPKRPAPRAVFFEQEESRGLRTHRYAFWRRLDEETPGVLFDMRADPSQRQDLWPEHEGKALVQELDATLVGFFAKYSDPEYDLWRRGVAKGTSPRMFYWLGRNPWPWLRKLWQDFVTSPPRKPAFSDGEQSG